LIASQAKPSHDFFVVVNLVQKARIFRISNLVGSPLLIHPNITDGKNATHGKHTATLFAGINITTSPRTCTTATAVILDNKTTARLEFGRLGGQVVLHKGVGVTDPNFSVPVRSITRGVGASDVNERSSHFVNRGGHDHGEFSLQSAVASKNKTKLTVRGETFVCPTPVGFRLCRFRMVLAWESRVLQ